MGSLHTSASQTWTDILALLRPAVTVQQIKDRLDVTTVAQCLAAMLAAGVVVRQKVSKTYLYQVRTDALDERDATARVRAALRVVFDVTGAESIEIHSGDREPGALITREDILGKERKAKHG